MNTVVEANRMVETRVVEHLRISGLLDNLSPETTLVQAVSYLTGRLMILRRADYEAGCSARITSIGWNYFADERGLVLSIGVDCHEYYKLTGGAKHRHWNAWHIRHNDGDPIRSTVVHELLKF